MFAMCSLPGEKGHDNGVTNVPPETVLFCNNNESKKIWRPVDPDSSAFPSSLAKQLRYNASAISTPTPSTDLFQQFSWNCFLKSKWESFASTNYNQQYQQFQRQSLSLLRRNAVEKLANKPNCNTSDCSCPTDKLYKPEKRKLENGKHIRNKCFLISTIINIYKAYIDVLNA